MNRSETIHSDISERWSWLCPVWRYVSYFLNFSTSPVHPTFDTFKDVRGDCTAASQDSPSISSQFINRHSMFLMPNLCMKMSDKQCGYMTFCSIVVVVAACLTYGWSTAWLKRPPTLSTPSSNNGLNLYNLLSLVFATTFFASKIFISLENTFAWRNLMTTSLACFLSAKLVLPFAITVLPLYSLIFHINIARALMSFNQSENSSNWSSMVLSALALVLHTNVLQSSGSSSLISPTLTSLSSSLFCQRNFGPLNQLDDFNCSAVKPQDAWSAGLSSEAMWAHCSGVVLDLILYTRQRQILEITWHCHLCSQGWLWNPSRRTLSDLRFPTQLVVCCWHWLQWLLQKAQVLG